MNTDSTSQSLLVDDLDGFVGRLRRDLGEHWSDARPKCIARAPGRLDVMGGFAEYTGSLVLSYPLAHATVAAVTARTDQTVAVFCLHHEGNGEIRECRWPLATFYGDPDALAEPQRFTASLGDVYLTGAREVAAATYALLDAKAVPNLGGGLTVVLRSTLDGIHGIGAAGATTIAVLAALDHLWGLKLQPLAWARLACHGHNRLWNRAQDVADAASAALAEEGAILQLQCRNQEVLGCLPLPDGLALTGVDCGARHRAADEKYIDARVTAFMGRNIIGRILQAGGSRVRPAWGGYLSQLTVSDYVVSLRDRLPTKMKGADFLSRFGESGDPLTSIDPNKVYKIRSRTEHHIYENARARQFAERLARSARTGDLHAAMEAGELMYASHWSYGQRCGLGSIQTDRLVTLLRNAGPAAGVYGAKISGRGAGGTVVVLHADTDLARGAIAKATEEYTRSTGCRSQVLGGTSPGAMAWGVHEVD